MEQGLTLTQRRRRAVDSVFWAILLSVLGFQILVPVVTAASPTAGTLLLALMIYLPLLAATMLVTYSWFGLGVGGYEVIRPEAWAAVFLGFWVTMSVPPVAGVIRLCTMSIAYLLCEHLLPERKQATA